MVNAGHLRARGTPNRVPTCVIYCALSCRRRFSTSRKSRGGEFLCDLCCPPIDRSPVSFFSSLPKNGGEKAAAAPAGGGNPNISFRETNRFKPLYVNIIMPAPIFLSL